MSAAQNSFPTLPSAGPGLDYVREQLAMLDDPLGGFSFWSSGGFLAPSGEALASAKIPC
jgi:hypothetical protein